MNTHVHIAWPVMAALTLALCACGGSNGAATIGGSVSGLASGTTVVLQNNGADSLTISANGSFSFPVTVGADGGYAVSVLTQPTGQLCTVGNGSGTVDSSGDDVSNVTIVCVSTSTIQGTVSGLNAGTSVTLSNGSVLLPIAVNGAFSFPGTLAVGATYTVTVTTQPAGQTCTVTNGTGTVATSGTVSVTVTCS